MIGYTTPGDTTRDGLNGVRSCYADARLLVPAETPARNEPSGNQEPADRGYVTKYVGLNVTGDVWFCVCQLPSVPC